MRVVTFLAAVAAAVLLSGCAALPASDDIEQHGKPLGAAATAAHEFAFQSGDCLVVRAGGGAESEQVVPCTEPHDEEAFYEFTLSGGAFPGDDSIWTVAEQNCGPQFEMFVGLDYTASSLDWFYHGPVRDSWDAGFRQVVCIVYDPVGQVTGSLAGAVR